MEFSHFRHEIQSVMMFRGFHDPFKSRHFESNEACRRNSATGISPWIIYKKNGRKTFFLLYLNHGEVLRQMSRGVCSDDRSGAVGRL